MTRRTIGRRRFVTSTAALSSAMVAAPFVRGAYAAGKLSIGFWDHWVPGANAGAEAVAKAWAEKEKVDLQIDFITSQGNKLILTAAAEAQARSGHDILALGSWDCARYSDQLVPVDDIMAPLIKQNGAASAITTVPRQDRRQVAGRAGNPGRPVQGTDVTHRPPEAARRHRRPGHVSGRCAAQGRQLDARHLPEGGGRLPQGGLPVRHRARHDGQFGRYLRRHLPELRCGAGERQGRHHGQERQRQEGARVLEAARRLSAAGCAGLGRRQQQQDVRRRQDRADHEPAQRLGRGAARQAGSRRADMAPRHGRRPCRTLRPVHDTVLGSLELRQEPERGQRAC